MSSLPPVRHASTFRLADFVTIRRASDSVNGCNPPHFSVCNTSPGNYQAWVALPEGTEKDFARCARTASADELIHMGLAAGVEAPAKVSIVRFCGRSIGAKRWPRCQR